MLLLLQENVYVAILNLMEAKAADTLLDPCSEMRLGWEQMRIPKAGNKFGNYFQVKRKKEKNPNPAQNSITQTSQVTGTDGSRKQGAPMANIGIKPLESCR